MAKNDVYGIGKLLKGFSGGDITADFLSNESISNVEEYMDGKPTGKKVAYGDLRSYDDVTKISEEYRMKGQPREGMGWIRDADGFGSETVYAWSTDVKVGGVCDLPEGIIVIVRTGNDD